MTTAEKTKPRARRARGSGSALSRLVPLLLVLTGVIVLLYPVAATQYNNHHQLQFSQQYNSDVQQVSPVDLSAELAAAREYNSTLTGVPILDPYLDRAATDPGSKAWQEYAAQLNRFEAMARVRVPSALIDLVVRHGTGEDSLTRGAGHLYGTSLPVGGESTHAVLTSHTGMANATLFDHLIEVKEGDLIFIDVLGETLAYQVDQIKVVLPTEISDLTIAEGKDHLTLFTCTPYAVNSHRLLVRGERIPYTPEVAEQGEQQSQQFSVLRLEKWMWGLIGGAGLGLAALIVVIVRDRRARRRPVGAGDTG